MATITLKDIIQGQKTKEVKSFNTDLFKSDSENITENFDKNDYDYIELIETNTDDKTGLLKETIIAFKGQDSYLINTVPSLYNGEVTVSIFQKWLTLSGFNYFTKDNENFYDEEGHILEIVKEYYNNVLKDNNLEITYQDILDLGEFNSEYNCVILQFQYEEFKYYITINEKQQLSKITKKQSIAKMKATTPIKVKSILG